MWTQELQSTWTQSRPRHLTTFTSRIFNKAKVSSPPTRFSSRTVAQGPPLMLGPQTLRLSTALLWQPWPNSAVLELRIAAMETYVVTVVRLTRDDIMMGKYKLYYIQFNLFSCRLINVWTFILTMIKHWFCIFFCLWLYLKKSIVFYPRYFFFIYSLYFVSPTCFISLFFN